MSTAAKASTSQRASEHAGPERAPSAPKAASATDIVTSQAAAGNQALQRMLGIDRVRAMSHLTPPDDPAEHAADRLAARGRPALLAYAPPVNAELRVVRGGGVALDPSLRSGMERHLGAAFGDVRLHTGSDAAAAACALNARAFTAGRDIVFGTGQFAPETRPGRELLAHELAHTLQLPIGGHMLFRKPYGPSLDDHPDPGGGKPAATPEVPAEHPIIVEIENPSLDSSARARKEDKQQFAVHVPPSSDPPLQLKHYIVPRLKLKPPATAPGGTPPAAPPMPASATPPSNVPTNPDFPPGSTATTIDGAVLKVAASTPDHIITADYTKFAVGAASTSALKLADGTAIIIDAGINADNMGLSEKALAQLTMDKLAAYLGDVPVAEFLISHAHGDHTSLAPEIMRRFPVDKIRINSVQARWPGYKELRQALIDAQNERIKAVREKFAKDIEAQRAEWVKKTGQQFAEDQRQIEWEKYIEAEFQRRTAEIPGAAKAKESILVQAKKGVLDVVERDLQPGRQQGESKGDPAKVEFAADDPFRIYETQGDIKNKRVLDQRKNTKDADVDPNASSYFVVLPSGFTLIIMPDLRANDMERLKNRFNDIIGKVNGKSAARMQMWDMTHHMQAGWTGSGVSARQFSKIVDFLYTYHARKGTDIVVVSAEADLSKPNAPTLVDPANLWLLRSLGFEAYLATSGRDVRVIDIVTSQSNKVTGVIGAKAPGQGPKELSIKRAKMAVEQINAELETLRLQAPKTSGKKGAKAPKQPMTPDELAAEAKRVNRIADLEALRGKIDHALEETLTEIAELSKRPAQPSGKETHTTQSLDDAGKRDFPKQKALDELLENNNFDRPVMTDSRLTDMALVVLKQEPGVEAPAPGTPADRARQLAETRSRILEIEARINAGEVTDAIRIQLITELTQYKTILQNELNPADKAQAPVEGVSRTVLADDLTSIEAKLTKLGVAESETQFKREVKTGVLAEQQVIAVNPPSKALEATGKALDVFGRGMGVVMVITTVRGQADLIDRLQNKQANPTEAIVGTVHNVASGVVAVRMVRGMKVGPGAMALLSVLDLGTALARDYGSDEERNIEVAYSAISNSINLGLMVAGEIIASIPPPNPVTMVAGALIAFLGPVILEKLGVHAWLERKLGFDPSSVTQVKQTLRDLMNDYRVVIGSIELAERSAKGDTAAVGKPADIAAETGKAIWEYRVKAAELELEILDEFKSAYDDAREAHTGLKDLDIYRSWFMQLRYRAGLTDMNVVNQMESWHRGQVLLRMTEDNDLSGPEDEQPVDIKPLFLSPDEIDRRFGEMDDVASANELTADQVHDMSQWAEIYDQLQNMEEAMYSGRHDKFMEYQRKVQSMIDNANYRLNPRAQGSFRSKPLLKKDSPGYSAYRTMLDAAEARFTMLQNDYLIGSLNISGLQPPSSVAFDQEDGDGIVDKVAFDPVMRATENALKGYRMNIDQEHAAGPSEDLARRIVTDTNGAEDYKAFLGANPRYKGDLQRLQSSLAVIESMLDHSKRLLSATTDPELSEKQLQRYQKSEISLRATESLRTDNYGMYFESEVDQVQAAARKQEVEKVLSAFGEADKNTAPLNLEELTALKEHPDYGEPGKNFKYPVSSRLERIPGGLHIDRFGNIENVYRMNGMVDLMVQMTTHRGPPHWVDSSENALVGILGNAGTLSDEYGNPVRWVTVMPLNDAADRVFGGYQFFDVSMNVLQPMNIDLLKYTNQPPKP